MSLSWQSLFATQTWSSQRAVLVGLCVAMLLLPACEESSDPSGPELPRGGAPGPFLPEVLVGHLLFHAVLPVALNPPPSPDDNAFTVELRAQNLSSDDIVIRYRVTGFHFYSGAQRVLQYTEAGLSQEHEVRIPLDGERIINGFGIPAGAPLALGLEEDVYLVTMPIEIVDVPLPVELLVGLIRIAQNNGLLVGGPVATRRAVVSGRVTTSEGEPIPVAVRVALRWDECNRPPIFEETAANDSQGEYRVEAEIEEQLVEACVTVVVTPFPGSGVSEIVKTGQLTFDGPVINGVVSDSVRIDAMVQ